MRATTFPAATLTLLLGCWSLYGQPVVRNRAPLAENAFDPLPLGSIHPKGWLLQQEQIQAAGLTGHLDEFWKDVGDNSGWLGGTGESWERGPYYLDGLLPLAYQLQDKKLVEKAKRWVEWTLNSQQRSGQFGPASNDDWWPRMVMLKVLTQYQEATGDQRVVPLVTKYFQFELNELPKRPLRDWGKYRWQDNADSVLWLYNRTGDSNLLALAKLLHEQGFDWEADFNNFRFVSKQTVHGLGLDVKGPIPEMAMQTHGVNNAMALKAAPVWWLVSHDVADKTALYRQLGMLDKYHGLPNGMFSADEHFSGTDPSQGSELCAVVETMFSYERDFAVLGDATLADRLERTAYNALPGTISNDMWSHQYDQQPNQIACSRAQRQWSTNGQDSNLFGLEPNFGCCTANFHQGWPKLVSALWMATPDDGLVTSAYAPNQVQANLNGTQVTIDEDTAYPFRGQVDLTVRLKTEASFPLWLRIPAWAVGMKVTLNGSRPVASDEDIQHPGFYRLSHKWKDGDSIRISFPMSPRVSHWYRDAAVFERGPLVFSLPFSEQWTELKKYAEKSGDWQVTSSHAWNFAAELGDCAIRVKESNSGAIPFNATTPAIELQIKVRRLAAWQEVDHSAGPLPLSPVSSDQTLQVVNLVPYGAAKLRITEFPYLEEQSSCPASSAQARSGILLH